MEKRKENDKKESVKSVAWERCDIPQCITHIAWERKVPKPYKEQLICYV